MVAVAEWPDTYLSEDAAVSVCLLEADSGRYPSLPRFLQWLEAQQRAAQEELAKLSDPIERVNAYVLEQIEPKLDAAVSAAMAKKKVALLVQRNVVIKNTPGTDLTPDILAELNALVPSVSITPRSSASVVGHTSGHWV